MADAANQPPKPTQRATDAAMPWPLTNPANSLSVNRAYLRRVCGLKFGYGPNPAGWDNTKEAMIDLAIETGLRTVYHPQVLEGERYAWEWSFLTPTETFQTLANQPFYDLPPGFSMLDGPLTYKPGVSSLTPPIQEVGDNQILLRRQHGDSFGKPQLCAIRVKPLDPTGTRYEIIFWPTPDDTYDINMRYRANPDLLRSETDCPLGGAAMSQTFIEACLLAVDELKGVASSIHAEKFDKALRAAISHDRLVSSPDTLGIGHDRSDRPIAGWNYNFHLWSEQSVTYNGDEIT